MPSRYVSPMPQDDYYDLYAFFGTTLVALIAILLWHLVIT